MDKTKLKLWHVATRANDTFLGVKGPFTYRGAYQSGDRARNKWEQTEDCETFGLLVFNGEGMTKEELKAKAETV
jgi:hypothetical protein